MISFAPAAQRGFLDGSLRERARGTAIELGERLLETSWNPGPDPFAQWTPSRHLNGSAGFALTFLALAAATGESRFEAAMDHQLRLAAGVDDLPDIGLYSGLSGLRVAAAMASKVEPRYGRLVDRCDAFVDARLPAEPVAPQTFSDFDTISGWSGVRLARCVDGPREPDRASDLLAWVIASESRWRCPHPLTGAIENDLGLAHGLAGMLAALALTLESPDDSTRESMHERAWFLARRGIEVRGVLAWPPTVQADRRERYRGAWCYGAPGVLAALYQTALFLRDVNLEVLVLGQFIRAAELSSYDLMLDGDAICHGTSGAALIFASAAAASGLAALGAAAERFVTELLDRLERSGGRCMVPSDESGAEHASYGLLTGVAGAILTLLTLTGDAGASWMRAHAIQPIR